MHTLLAAKLMYLKGASLVLHGPHTTLVRKF